MEKKITAQLIFEMLGRPASHLEETMNQFLNKIGEERGVKVLTKKINEPKKIEDTKQELFTTFSETEMEFDNLNELFRIVFFFYAITYRDTFSFRN